MVICWRQWIAVSAQHGNTKGPFAAPPPSYSHSSQPGQSTKCIIRPRVLLWLIASTHALRLMNAARRTHTLARSLAECARGRPARYYLLTLSISATTPRHADFSLAVCVCVWIMTWTTTALSMCVCVCVLPDARKRSCGRKLPKWVLAASALGVCPLVCLTSARWPALLIFPKQEVV